MRIIQFLVVISIGILLSACKKEDDRVCMQTDFVGTFIGTTVCANGGTANGTITVSAGSTDTELKFNVSNSLFDVEIDGCNFSGTQKDANVDLVYSGNLNGDKMEVTVTGLVFMR